MVFTVARTVALSFASRVSGLIFLSVRFPVLETVSYATTWTYLGVMMGSKANLPKTATLPDINFEEDGSVIFTYKKQGLDEPKNMRPMTAEMMFLMACLGVDSGGCDGSH
jgi:hypothetical protein